MLAGGVVADDWVSIHWHKMEYLISCGLRPWYLDHTEPGSAASTTLDSAPAPPHMTPEAPHVLAQHQQQQQQPNQFQQSAGQQQAWAYPGASAGPNQAQPGQQWQGGPGSGGGSGNGVQAVVKVGQPWQSSPGRWQCDLNITLVNRGEVCLQLHLV